MEVPVWADQVWEAPEADPEDRAGCMADQECPLHRHHIADGVAIAEDAVCRDVSCMY
ncbi:MAG: hypothetical protein LIO96_12650 [Lachnospiraceae bacterium]|nr:hypothetical protein [Lachnospiraceae bacterium]